MKQPDMGQSGRHVQKGQRWSDGFVDSYSTTWIVVTRVARDGSWADVRVSQNSGAGAVWGKRMALPFPSGWERIGWERAKIRQGSTSCWRSLRWCGRGRHAPSASGAGG